MIQVFADGRQVFDSRLERLDLAGLEVTHKLNAGGTAKIVMPAKHPAYNYFVGHRTVVTIYRDGVLRFRGRALYPADNFCGQRTVTCEGERGFLRDSISRPYSYSGKRSEVFRALIQTHNEQVDDFKQFSVGQITVEDKETALSSDKAEPVQDTVGKLLDSCGGYIVFTNAEDGTRAINWLASVDKQSSQTIEFGENLLDFSSTGANTTELATGLIPYGAMDEKTKKRITIESVNSGKDYIIAADAQAIRGTIMATKTWDGITDPAELFETAQAYLNEKKVFITSLNLTALDLSYLNKNIDTFTEGDLIRVVSIPHGVNEIFQLTQLKENLLDPAKSKVTLGKEIQSLTGSDLSIYTKGQSAISNAAAQLQSAYKVSAQQVAADVKAEVMAQITPDVETLIKQSEDRQTAALTEEKTAREDAILLLTQEIDELKTKLEALEGKE